LIVAERQTAGRGRGSNRWWSAPGALTFSLVLEGLQSGLPVERWPQIALAAGAAVGEAIELSIPKTTAWLKWPNDVYLAGKKCSGILVEAPAVATGRLIVGIGVNVNNRFAEAPAELQALATSMADVADRSFDPTDVLLAILSRLDSCLSQLAVDETDLFERWRTRCLLTDKRVCLRAGSRQVSGVCQGIDDAGRLLLLTADGLERHLSGTVVSFE
jgi:BirA family biotin operon repressor/biotin-[acetyl-CoA-carboxylase] ligase